MKRRKRPDSRAINLSLRDVVEVVFRRKWLILSTLITAGAAAAVFGTITPDTYESRMKFMVRNARAEAPLTSGDEKVSDRNEVSREQITSEIELIKSRDLLEQVVDLVGLSRPKIDGAEITAKDREKAILKLEKDLDISSVKRANIIKVRVGRRWLCAVLLASLRVAVEGTLVHDAIPTDARDCDECTDE